MFDVKNLIKKLKANSAAKYLISGTFAFSVDYTLLLITYYIVKLPLELATSIGFFSGFIVSFSLNRQWVFWGKHKKNISRQVTEYAILLIFNYFFTVWGVNLLNNHGIRPFIGKIGVMGLVVCWNYVLFRWVIFTSTDNSQESE